MAQGIVLTRSASSSGTGFSSLSYPSGFENPLDATFSFNSTTGTFTISPVGSYFNIYVSGIKIVKTVPESVTIASTVSAGTVLYFYYNSSGALEYSTIAPASRTNPIASLFYLGVGQPTVTFEDRTNANMPVTTQDALFGILGTAYQSGFDLTGYTLTGSGNSDTDAQISLTNGFLYAADLQIPITNNTTPNNGQFIWQQPLNGPFTSVIVYNSGTNIATNMTAPSTFPVLPGTQRIQYQYFNGTDWITADADEGNYVFMYVVAIASYEFPIITIVGGQASRISDIIINNNLTNLGTILSGIPINSNIRPLYGLIFQTSVSYTNTVHAALRHIIDFRSSNYIAPLDHSALSDLGDDDHPQYVHVSIPRTITAQHTFAPTLPEAPFLLGTDAQGQLVAGFNADLLDGQHASSFQLANSNLTALANTFTTGLYTITGSGTSSTIMLTSNSNTLTLTNANGVAGNINLDLSPVGTSISNTFVKITTNQYGQISATSSVDSSDILTALGYTPLNISGDTMSGALNMGNNLITNVASPVSSSDVATKQYVDNLATGLIWQNPIIGANLISDTGGPPTSPSNEDTYIIQTSADITGSWASFAPGDIVQYNGTTSTWDNIGVAAIGSRFGVAFTSSTTPAGSFTNEKNYIVEISGGSVGAWTYTTSIPASNYAVFVNQSSILESGISYTYSSSLTRWIQFSSGTAITAGAGLYASGTSLNVGTASSSRIVVNSTNIDLALTGVIANTYSKVTVDVYGRITSGSALSLTDITTALGYTPQQQDTDLTALANTSTTGLYTITGVGSSATRQLVAPSSGITITNPDGVAGNPTLALSSNLLAAETLTTNGIIAQTSQGNWTTIQLVAPTSGITITNPSGVTGNPTFALTNDLLSIESISTTGFAVRYDNTTSSWTTRTIGGTSGQIVVNSGDGVAGNPVISIDPTYIGQSSITTLGTISTGTWNGTAISPSYGGTGVTSTPVNGQLLIGNGSGFSLNTLTAGTGIGIINAAGNITISAASSTPGSKYTGKLTAVPIPAVSGTTTMVANATPTITSGFQLTSLTVTPVSTSSTYILSCSVATDIQPNNRNVTMALFRTIGSTNTLVATTTININTSGQPKTMTLYCIDAPSTTSTITYSIRYGMDGGPGTCYANRSVSPQITLQSTSAFTAQELL